MKKVLVGAAVFTLGGFLGACDNNSGDEEANGDAVTAASISADPEQVEAALGADGTWIVAITDDVELNGDVTVAGTFHNQDDESQEEYRKLALYDQDEDRNVTDEYTLTVGTLTVESPNFRIQHGTIDGDVYVEAEGFELYEDTVITGDLTFASEDVEASATISGTVEGETVVE